MILEVNKITKQFNMKIRTTILKNALTFLFFIAIANFSYAQKETFFRLGVKGGVNINKIDGVAYKNGFNYNFQVGAFTQFNFSKRLGIQPEVNFVQTQSEFTDDANVIYDDLFGGGTQHKAKLDYLEIPLLLNIDIGPTEKVKLQLGPSFDGLLRQRVDSLKANVGNVFKNANVSGMAGLWIQLPAVVLSARYKWGILDMNNTSNNNTWKNQAIQISLGLTF
jgi:hypothetical protein